MFVSATLTARQNAPRDTQRRNAQRAFRLDVPADCSHHLRMTGRPFLHIICLFRTNPLPPPVPSRHIAHSASYAAVLASTSSRAARTACATNACATRSHSRGRCAANFKRTPFLARYSRLRPCGRASGRQRTGGLPNRRMPPSPPRLRVRPPPPLPFPDYLRQRRETCSHTLAWRYVGA
jgi:hypothetical protein